MPRFLISMIAVGLALGVGMTAMGCGGEGGGEPLSDEEFVAAFVEACTGYSEAIGGIAEQFDTDADSPEAFRESYAQLVPAFETLTADLEQIEPPEADAEDYDELVSTLGELGGLYEENLDLLADEAVAIAGGAGESRAGLALDERFTELSDELETLATGLDLPTDCADPVIESGGSTVPEP